jgi:hypothetical protein
LEDPSADQSNDVRHVAVQSNSQDPGEVRPETAGLLETESTTMTSARQTWRGSRGRLRQYAVEWQDNLQRMAGETNALSAKFNDRRLLAIGGE